jgi:hypothetical protein
MLNAISKVTTKVDGQDGLIVTFSDRTITGYVAEELLELRPKREHVGHISPNSQILDHAPTVSAVGRSS